MAKSKIRVSKQAQFKNTKIHIKISIKTGKGQTEMKVRTRVEVSKHR